MTSPKDRQRFKKKNQKEKTKTKIGLERKKQVLKRTCNNAVCA